jgi:photosynthetic reaction center H subunit
MYIDLAQITLYVFWFFFAGLIYYLQRESNREGVPLESETSEYVRPTGVTGLPAPKTFILPHGAGTASFPNDSRDTRPIAARAMDPWPGSPLVPTGNPMLDGVGPGAYAERANVPDLTVDGHARIVPMRVAKDYHVDLSNMDPRGMSVVGADGVVAGKVSDIWVDRSEALIRYLEVEVGQRKVLLPINFAEIRRTRDAGAMPGLEWFFAIILPGPKRAANDGTVKVDAILAKHFADVPATASTDHVTRREEDRICGYYGAGTLYATKERAEPLV